MQPHNTQLEQLRKEEIEEEQYYSKNANDCMYIRDGEQIQSPHVASYRVQIKYYSYCI
jgi:hypothetical protein